MTEISLSESREPEVAAMLPEAKALIGKVASPPGKEATSEAFFFWFPHEVLVEKGQIIRTEYLHGGSTIRFYGVVQEVYRQSRFQNLAEEFDRYDGQTEYVPPYEIPGVNYAQVSILRTVPDLLPWQEALYGEFLRMNPPNDDFPKTANLPTGLGKTSILAIWLIALAADLRLSHQLSPHPGSSGPTALPRPVRRTADISQLLHSVKVEWKEWDEWPERLEIVVPIFLPAGSPYRLQPAPAVRLDDSRFLCHIPPTGACHAKRLCDRL